MKRSIREEKINVEQLIKKQYPNCEILKCQLQYVDWSSTVRDIDEDDVFYNRPTRAKAIIMDSIKYDIELERGLFGWTINGCYSQSVVDADVIEYYGLIRMSSVGSAVDMEEWCKENWVLQLGDGSRYSVVDHTKEGGSIYFSVKVCDALYIVENNSIKQLRLRDKDWTEADYNYSEIKKYSFIKQLTKEEFDEILSLKPLN